MGVRLFKMKLEKLVELKTKIDLCINRDYCNFRKVLRNGDKKVYCWGENMKNCQTYQYYERYKGLDINQLGIGV